ncbi:MAG: hypothetical protein IT507_02915 [Burkholderiaceae bacterium]|nr:hypothetical protein [Burkholderiaceae bacterium]
MPKNFVRRTYEAWIRKHAWRFRYPPWIKESRRHGFTVRFLGLAPELTFQVRQRRSWGRAEIMIHDAHGVYWDILDDFDLVELRIPDGRYCCDLCEGCASYPSRAALWEAHVFEPLLDWVNQRTADQWVCLYGTPEQDAWGACILSCDVIAGINCSHAFPLVMGSGCLSYTCYVN